MEVFKELADLLSERQQVIQISENIAVDLRSLRAAQEIAKDPSEIVSINRQHRRALQSFNRAQQRLRELNAGIKWRNLKAQEETQRRAKADRLARRKKADT